MKFTKEKLEKAFTGLSGQERFSRIAKVISHNGQ
jgi:hypothetical protein